MGLPVDPLVNKYHRWLTRFTDVVRNNLLLRGLEIIGVDNTVEYGLQWGESHSGFVCKHRCEFALRYALDMFLRQSMAILRPQYRLNNRVKSVPSPRAQPSALASHIFLRLSLASIVRLVRKK